MIADRRNKLVFNACVNMLGEVPSRALKGMTRQELGWLVEMYLEQGKALKDMMK